MEVLLRHRSTRLFFAGNKRWVSKDAEAFRFGTIEEAVARTREENLRRMELVLGAKTILPLGNVASSEEALEAVTEPDSKAAP